MKDLRTYFYTGEMVAKAVDGVNFAIDKAMTLGLVGESGCGKSVTALSILRLVPFPGKIVGGEVLFEGEDILTKTEQNMRSIRGARISMIFQDPMNSLNPLHKAADQIAENIQLHQGLNKTEAREKAVQMMQLVGIPEAQRRANEYPHQFSGGMQQRVMIAMALSCKPALLIADEPTTALDVTIQEQVLELMRQLRRDLGTSILLITHDLGVVAEMADVVGVMYLGKIVEYARALQLFSNPLHPYTLGLMRSFPRLDVETRRLNTIEGIVPSLSNRPSGCGFHDRCPSRTAVCSQKEPSAIEAEPGHFVNCFL